MSGAVEGVETSASRSKGEDVAGVAALLTEAQRATLLYGECAKPTGPYDCICGADFETLPGALVCIRCRLEGGDGAVVLTPLGIAVRQHLTDQEGQNR